MEKATNLQQNLEKNCFSSLHQSAGRNIQQVRAMEIELTFSKMREGEREDLDVMS